MSIKTHIWWQRHTPTLEKCFWWWRSFFLEIHLINKLLLATMKTGFSCVLKMTHSRLLSFCTQGFRPELQNQLIHFHGIKIRLTNWLFVSKVIQREPYNGIGKPEPLKHSLAGYWSRRINDEHRIVYKAEEDQIFIAQLWYHYECWLQQYPDSMETIQTMERRLGINS